MAPATRLPVLLALGLLATVPATVGQQAPIAVPGSLGEPAAELGQGLSELSEAEDVATARTVHERSIDPAAAQIRPYAADLADRHGELLATYLDRLATQVAAGNLSDARSLAGAAAGVVDEHLQPAAAAWDGNRTAIAAGPITRSDDGARITLVLVNPPPGGVGAFDASLTVDRATPEQARLSAGQGQTQVDPANGTVRWASFDASAMAHLSADGRDRVALGDALLADPPPAGQTVEAQASVADVTDADGEPMPAIGVTATRTMPTDEGALPTAWLALAGVGLGAVGLAWWVRGWEV